MATPLSDICYPSKRQDKRKEAAQKHMYHCVFCLFYLCFCLMTLAKCWPLFELCVKIKKLIHDDNHNFMHIFIFFVQSVPMNALWWCRVWGQCVCVCVCVFVLASGSWNSIWAADIRAVLSEGILGEQRAPTFAWNDKKVCRQEREWEGIRLWERERQSLQYVSSN